MYRNSEIDMESVAAMLSDAVEKVKGQENPEILDEIKKTYKKTVPFSLRMYVASYLTKEAMKHYRGSYRSQRKDYRENKSRFSNERNIKERKPFATSEAGETKTEERQPRPRVQIDPEVAATIFISIGRNRRVFPRDLVGLLISVAGLERDRIGDIRVLANYSFVQLFAEDSEKAITALNGYDYRGRKLAVSYSKQKDETSEDSFAVNQVEDENIDEQSAEDAAAYAAAEKAMADKDPFTSHITSNENIENN